MEAPDFWDNPERSQEMTKQLKSLKDDMDTYQSLISQKEDMETLIEMGYEENDPEVIPEIQELLEQFEKNFEAIRIKTLLSGEYDKCNAIVKLNAGAGGTEACDWCGTVSYTHLEVYKRQGTGSRGTLFIHPVCGRRGRKSSSVGRTGGALCGRDGQMCIRDRGITSYARLDFLMREDGRMYCLEANTLPGMTDTSLLPQEAQAVGISYPELCQRLIEVSLQEREQV